nr:helix-turn-helix transcriptional regulator [Mycobacterium paragordonae]
MGLDEAPGKSSKSAGRPLGATGDTVRRNIRDIRDRKGISGPELSSRLDNLHRPIPPLGIHRIESGQRRVDVDDLVAIALALDVSPVSLLMPHAVEATERVRITGIKNALEAEQVWEWLTANLSLRGRDEFMQFLNEAWPAWKVGPLNEAAAAAFEEQKQQLERQRQKRGDD